MSTKEVICWNCEAPNQVEDNEPELLEALKAMLEYVPSLWGDITIGGKFPTHISADAMHKADEAILKANG